jgi:hypothetical protein
MFKCGFVLTKPVGAEGVSGVEGELPMLALSQLVSCKTKVQVSTKPVHTKVSWLMGPPDHPMFCSIQNVEWSGDFHTPSAVLIPFIG